jgi:hypothetical protein
MLISRNATIGGRSARTRNVRVVDTLGLRAHDPRALQAGDEALSDHEAQAIAPLVLATANQAGKVMAKGAANVVNAPSKVARKEDPLYSNFSLP